MTEKERFRSFIAIPLPDRIRENIAGIQDRLKPALPDVRWVRPEALHLTLHFFGDLDDDSLAKAAAVMVSIERLFPPFPMTLGGVGAFPSPHRARVFWLGVESGKLAGLHATLQQHLRKAGFPCEEREFRPHITLGRSRGGTRPAGHILSAEAATLAGEMTVDSLVLYESELLPTGAVHRPRQTIQFTAD